MQIEDFFDLFPIITGFIGVGFQVLLDLVIIKRKQVNELVILLLFYTNLLI